MADLLESLAPAARLTSSDLRTMLRIKYPASEYALLFEVPNGTGTHANRSADAIAVSLWPSRGLTFSGFEIKVSRQDWMRELADPKKADDIAKYCDFWSLVVSEEKIVQPGELPHTWGLFVAKGNGLRCLKEPVKLDPVPLNRVFTAAMCRAAQKASPAKAEIDAAVAAAVKLAKEDFERVGKMSRSDLNSRYEALQKSVAEFEAASGVHINRWDGKRIGEAVKVLLNGGLKEQARTIEAALKQIAGVHEGLKELHALVPKESTDG